MKEHPILFNTDMVRAILAGQKTETRRVFKRQPIGLFQRIAHTLGYPASLGWLWAGFGNPKDPTFHKCPYGQVGDRLWVRETFAALEMGNGSHYAYRANGDIIGCHHWKPSIFMPRIASRITLEITEIKVERMQDITEEGALADGGWEYNNCTFHKAPLTSFKHLWDSINEKRGFGWDLNPWVWVVKFKVIDGQGA